MDLRLHDEGRESLRAGEYGSLTTRIWTGTVATSSLARMDASCKITSSYDGRSSTTATLDRDARPGDSVSGRFQIAFGSDTITGTFRAAPCDARPYSSPAWRSPVVLDPSGGDGYGTGWFAGRKSIIRSIS